MLLSAALKAFKKPNGYILHNITLFAPLSFSIHAVKHSISFRSLYLAV